MKHGKIRLSAILSLLLAASMILTGTQNALAYGTGGSTPGPVHENMVNYAMNVYQGAHPNTEMMDYLATIREGAWHEDNIDLVDDVVFGDVAICLTQTHFWDGDLGPDVKVDNVAGCGFDVRNSWQKALVIWGMALGEYRSGDKAAAYDYLGHVAHLLADQSVPAHAHEDAHPATEGGDIYEDWLTWPGPAELSTEEFDALVAAGPVDIPEIHYSDDIGPLYYLFYTMNQIGDYFPSDDDFGAGDGDYGWNSAYGDWIGDIYNELGLLLVTWDDLDGSDDNTNMLENIRNTSYFYAIRSTAALFDLFWQKASTASALTVVIDGIEAQDCHDELLVGDLRDADFFVRVSISDADAPQNEFWFRNEGNQIENAQNIYPGWAFGREVGLSGSVYVQIQAWDEDDMFSIEGADDKTDLDPGDGWDLDLYVNLATGEITGDAAGTAGIQLTSIGNDDSVDQSRIYVTVMLPNIPPEVDAGDDQTVDEGDDVTLSGTFTDPNTDDSWTYRWEMVSNPNGQSIPAATGSALPNTPIEFTFIPWDNGDYVFGLTVTDSYGASDTEEVVVTVLNVPPVASIDSLTDELGAEIGVDVPVALVGLDVNLEGSFTDAGYLDNHTAEIQWGDGNIDPDTAFNLFVDSTGWQLGYLHDTHIYAIPGDFTITLEVTDDDGGVDTQAIPIKIVDAAGAIGYVIDSLTQHADNPDIQAALDKMQGENGGDASNGALDMLEQGNLNAALEKIKQALEYMEAAEAADPTLDLTYDKGLLALAAKSVAVGAIGEAAAAANTPNDLLKIQDATDLVAEGDGLLAIPDYVSGVDKYQEAVREVQGI